MIDELEEKDFFRFLNPHERDSRLARAPPHRYIIDGDTEAMPVSTFYSREFPPFDRFAISEKLVKTTNPESKWFGRNAAEVRAEWQATADTGTLKHEKVERLLKNLHYDYQDPVIKRFLFWRIFRPNLIPYRSEYAMFSKLHRVAGTADLLTQNLAVTDYEEIVIVDFKIIPKLTFKGFCWCDKPGTDGLEDQKKHPLHHTRMEPFHTGHLIDSCTKYALSAELQHLEACKYIQYSMQLGIYKKILEECYGKRVSNRNILLLLHDSLDTFMEIEAKDLSAEVDNLFAKREFELKQS